MLPPDMEAVHFYILDAQRKMVQNHCFDLIFVGFQVISDEPPCEAEWAQV